MQSKERLVAMGFAPDILTDRGSLTPEQKLAGDMLLFSTGLMMLASVLWLAIYWSFGKTFSTTIPLVFQGLSTCTIVFYLRTKKLGVFCIMQLSLFLFTPFVLQWSIGNFVNASVRALVCRLCFHDGAFRHV
jgi:hypothetical protein